MPPHLPTDYSNNSRTDSYAQPPVSQVTHTADSPKEDPPEEPSRPAEQHTSWLERFLHGLFLLFVALAVLCILVWLDLNMYSEVVSRRPIGHFQRMSAPGGLMGHVVIETDTGSYPLRGTPVIARGTLLVLELRASGYRYICDEPRSLCMRTTAKEFKASNPSQGAIP